MPPATDPDAHPAESTDPSPALPADGKVGGWLLHAEQAVLDPSAMLERFGQVYRYPIDPSAAADAMAPGQPCFLVRTDRSKVVGIWAVGEVVAPCLELPATYRSHLAAPVAPPDADVQLYAEVELLPLVKPLALDKLLADKVLGASPLAAFARPGATNPNTNPVAVASAVVRAIETFDFWISEPSDEQRAALDALLEAEER